ncbi:MAG: hypothetical protein AAFQ98_10145 [Bacteroidota bacterium]
MGLILDKLKIVSAESWEGVYSFFKQALAFRVQFNPETYKESYENHYSSFRKLHGIGGPSRYALSEPTKISLTLVFDATGVDNFGVVQAFAGASNITSQIEEFKERTTYYKNSVHEPLCLRIIWGKLDFPGKLTKLDVHYTLFNTSGNPLRANVEVEFMSGKSDAEWEKAANPQSPDVTHQRQILAGETLPMLCHEIYGHERYYLKVAKANGLNDFRNIAPGTILHFPPLKSESDLA